MKVFALILTVSLIGVSFADILQPLSVATVIPGQYIIKLKDGVESKRFVSAQTLRSSDGSMAALKDKVGFTYSTAFNGFSARLDDTMLRSLNAMAEVEYIEPDQIATAQGQIQSSAPWGLARTSTRNVLSGSNYNFYYKTSSGTGATVYVIDTGINIAHRDFEGRASFGFSSIDGESTDDLNGHGTHVAGTIAGAQYGIAKKANVVAVKVLNRQGSGSWSGVVAGIDWVAANAPSSRAVINMSLGGGATTSVDEATENAVRRGITTVVAAGNSAANACNSSPARAASAITVAASDVNDRSASFTNYGSCVDNYAPGVSVLSAWIGSTTATNTISGTSMASPHVAGLAAYLIREHDLLTPAAVEAKINEKVTAGAVSSVPSGTPNRLIFNGGNGVHQS